MVCFVFFCLFLEGASWSKRAAWTSRASWVFWSWRHWCESHIDYFAYTLISQKQIKCLSIYTRYVLYTWIMSLFVFCMISGWEGSWPRPWWPPSEYLSFYRKNIVCIAEMICYNPLIWLIRQGLDGDNGKDGLNGLPGKPGADVSIVLNFCWGLKTEIQSAFLFKSNTGTIRASVVCIGGVWVKKIPDGKKDWRREERERERAERDPY